MADIAVPPDLDVLVVGGGITGASVALRLARTGRRVALVDPDPRGARGSATTASGAMLGVIGEVSHDVDQDALALRVVASAGYEEWLSEIEDTGTKVPRLRHGTFVVISARRAGDALAGEAMQRAAVAMGLPCERVEPEDVPGLAPLPGHRPERVLHLPREGWIDGPSLRGAVVRGAERSGASVIRAGVESLAFDGERVSGVTLINGEQVRADQVVVCAGAESVTLLATSGLPPGLMPAMVRAKGVGVHLRATPSERAKLTTALRTPNRAFACGLHVIPRTRGEVYVGATNRASRLPHVLGEATVGEVALLLTQAPRELYAGLIAYSLDRAVFGHRALAVDGTPVAGRTAVTGLSVVTGCYRDGVLLAPHLAHVVEQALDGQTDPRLSPDRATPAPSAAQVMSDGAADLAELLLDADDPTWAVQLPNLLRALGTLALQSKDPRSLRLERLLSRHPRIEMLPEGLIELLDDRASGD